MLPTLGSSTPMSVPTPSDPDIMCICEKAGEMTERRDLLCGILVGGSGKGAQDSYIYILLAKT